jgi:Ni/Co efflux regulator RcnB
MVTSPFAQVQQSKQITERPRFVITDSDADVDDVAAGHRSDDTSCRQHQQPSPPARLPFEPFGIHAQPFRVMQGVAGKQYMGSSSTSRMVDSTTDYAMSSTEAPDVVQEPDAWQSGDMMRSTSRSRERRSAYWAVFGERVEEARKGGSGRDKDWDQC